MTSSDHLGTELFGNNSLSFPYSKLSHSFLQRHEKQLISCLKFWLEQHPKKPIANAIPKTRNELFEFIAELFAPLKTANQQTQTCLPSQIMLEESVLKLYKKKKVQIQAMNWIQLLCYKVVQCPNAQSCRNFCEQKLLHNQFYDFELECPFFHDKKDRRRIILPNEYQDEFMYKGKYERIGEESPNPRFSHNYFESVYHPLFYKFFQCRRTQCQGSIYCPMKHAEGECVAWEEEFSLNWKKDRSIYCPKRKRSGCSNFQTRRPDIPFKHHVRKQKAKEEVGFDKENEISLYNQSSYNTKNNSGKNIWSPREVLDDSISYHTKIELFGGTNDSKESKFIKFFEQSEPESPLIDLNFDEECDSPKNPMLHTHQPFFNFENALLVDEEHCCLNHNIYALCDE